MVLVFGICFKHELLEESFHNFDFIFWHIIFSFLLNFVQMSVILFQLFVFFRIVLTEFRLELGSLLHLLFCLLKVVKFEMDAAHELCGKDFPKNFLYVNLLCSRFFAPLSRTLFIFFLFLIHGSKTFPGLQN